MEGTEQLEAIKAKRAEVCADEQRVEAGKRALKDIRAQLERRQHELGSLIDGEAPNLFDGDGDGSPQ